jgi:hypothetical protein
MIEPDYTTHTQLVQLNCTQTGDYINPHPLLGFHNIMELPPSSTTTMAGPDWTATTTLLDHDTNPVRAAILESVIDRITTPVDLLLIAFPICTTIINIVGKRIRYQGGRSMSVAMQR